MVRMGDFAVEDPDKDLGRSADQLPAADVEMEHEWRRIDAAQNAVERVGLPPALPGDDL